MYDLKKYKGVIVALNTVYDENDEIDTAAIKALVEKYKALGVSGIYACGSTGEGFLLSTQERKAVTKATVEAANGEMAVIVHVGSAATKEAIELAKHAESVGADAVSAVPSVYYRLSEASVKLHWTSIIEATKLPFIIYNIPQLTGFELSLNLFKEMAAMPKVIGVKNSSESTWQIERFKQLGGKDFIVFNGPDEQFLAGRLMGADAGIGGTYGCMAELYVHLNKLIENGEMAKAKLWQSRINDCIFALLECPSLYSASKAVITKRYGINAGKARAPFINIAQNDERIEKIAKMIDDLVLLSENE